MLGLHVILKIDECFLFNYASIVYCSRNYISPELQVGIHGGSH